MISLIRFVAEGALFLSGWNFKESLDRERKVGAAAEQEIQRKVIEARAVTSGAESESQGTAWRTF